MIVSNGRRHQEVFNGSVLSEFCSERFRSSAVALSEESGPSRTPHSARPPYEVVGANLNRASSARATPPSDGVVFHHADDKFLIKHERRFVTWTWEGDTTRGRSMARALPGLAERCNGPVRSWHYRSVSATASAPLQSGTYPGS